MLTNQVWYSREFVNIHESSRERSQTFGELHEGLREDAVNVHERR